MDIFGGFIDWYDSAKELVITKLLGQSQVDNAEII